jgi:hypothetical protein
MCKASRFSLLHKQTTVLRISPHQSNRLLLFSGHCTTQHEQMPRTQQSSQVSAAKLVAMREAAFTTSAPRHQGPSKQSQHTVPQKARLQPIQSMSAAVCIAPQCSTCPARLISPYRCCYSLLTFAIICYGVKVCAQLCFVQQHGCHYMLDTLCTAVAQPHLQLCWTHFPCSASLYSSQHCSTHSGCQTTKNKRSEGQPHRPPRAACCCCMHL